MIHVNAAFLRKPLIGLVIILGIFAAVTVAFANEPEECTCDEPSCDCENGSACTKDPVSLLNGSVSERRVSASVPGALPYERDELSRSGRHKAGCPAAESGGTSWSDGEAMWVSQGKLYYRSSAGQVYRLIQSQSDPELYDMPKDGPQGSARLGENDIELTLLEPPMPVRTGGGQSDVVRLSQAASLRSPVVRHFDYKGGKMASKQDSYGNQITYIKDSLGRISSVVTSQGWIASHLYIDDGSSNAGRRSSVVVSKSMSSSNYLSTISSVGYVYQDGTYHSECGAYGDLLLVHECSDVRSAGHAGSGSSTSGFKHNNEAFAGNKAAGLRLVVFGGANAGRIRTITSSSDTEITFDALPSNVNGGESYCVVAGDIKTTMYRYYDGSSQDGGQHQVKAVYEPDNVEALFRDQALSRQVSEPMDLLDLPDSYVVALNGETQVQLNQFAAREFTYYTQDVATDSIECPWSKQTENLEAQLSSTNTNEIGFVHTETVRSNCGSCSGGKAAGTRTYFYMDKNGGPVPRYAGTRAPDLVVRVTVEDTEGVRTVFGLNNNGVQLRKIQIVDPSAPKFWCESKIVGASSADWNRLKEVRSAAAHAVVESYASVGTFLNPSAVDDNQIKLDQYTLSTTAGLIHVYEPNSNGDVTDHWVKNGRSETLYYVSATDYGDGQSVPSEYPIATYAYPSETTVRSEGSVTTYSYEFWDAGHTQLKTKTMTMPAVSVANNGSNIHPVIKQYYDNKGRLRWQKNEDGRVDYYGQDPDTNKLAFVERDVNTSNVDSRARGGGPYWIGWGSSSAPLGFERGLTGTALQVATWTGYDDLGREVLHVDENNVPTYTVHKAGEVRVYPAYSGSRPWRAIDVTKKTVGGKILESYKVDPSGITFGTVPSGYETLPQAKYLSWTRYVRTYAAPEQVAQEWQYHNISSSGLGVSGTNYYVTQYGYENGQKLTETKPDGTIWLTQCDKLGRTIARWVGTDAGGASNDNPTNSDANNMKVVSHSYFDGATGTGLIVGDGNITREVAHFDDGNSQVTQFAYDWRGRLTQRLQPDGLGEVRTLDNLGRPKTVCTYKDLDGTMQISGTLCTKVEQQYDELGRVCWSMNYEVVNGVANDRLTTNYWYDDMGRSVKTALPNGLFLKTVYDALGRPIKNYTCYDLAESLYNDAKTITGDTVVEQSFQSYNTWGQVWLSASMKRNDNATGTGELTITVEPKGRPSYTARWFNAITHDVTSEVFYGTNNNNVLDDANDDFGTGQGYAAGAPAPDTSDKYIVSKCEYDALGRQTGIYDNRNRLTKTLFDALGRPAKVIENYVDGAVSEAETDTDRTTEIVYDASNKVTQLIAMNPKGNGNGVVAQTTTYVYSGTACLAGNRNDLLYQIQYPDNRGVTTCGYDRLGRRIKSSDSRGTVHEYDYDSAGRLLADKVTTSGASVDTAVLRIEYSYDDDGRVEHITSYNQPTGGNVVNDVKLVYDGWGNAVRAYQSHYGAVDEQQSTPYVEYTYEDGAVNGQAKYNRMTRMTYPNGRSVFYNYTNDSDDQSEQIHNRLSRVRSIAGINTATDGTPLADSDKMAQYDYMGIGSILTVKHPALAGTNGGGLTLSYGSGSNITGLDSLDRVIDQNWITGTNTVVDEYRYGYDRAGNRQWCENGLSSAAGEYYSYDSLDRVVNMRRGTLGGSYPDYTEPSSPNRERGYTLESLGNWRQYVEKASGGTTTLDHTRTHNAANELTAFGTITGTTWVNPTYDAAGNMITCPKPGMENVQMTLTYDAWNRLVGASWAVAGTQSMQIRYDGRNYRVTTLMPTSSTWNRTDFYYNDSWQVVEERSNNVADTSTVATSPIRQFVWDLRYIDAPVLVDDDYDGDGDCTTPYLDERLYVCSDANMNVTAMVPASGGSALRATYDVYGKPISGFFETGFCGYMYDSNTGLYCVRNRWYHPTHGRWVQRDPSGYVDGNSLYEYCVSSPNNGVDPQGLDTWVTFKCTLVSSSMRGKCDRDCNYICTEKGHDDFGSGSVSRDSLPPKPITTQVTRTESSWLCKMTNGKCGKPKECAATTTDKVIYTDKNGAEYFKCSRSEEKKKCDDAYEVAKVVAKKIKDKKLKAVILAAAAAAHGSCLDFANLCKKP